MNILEKIIEKFLKKEAIQFLSNLSVEEDMCKQFHKISFDLDVSNSYMVDTRVYRTHKEDASEKKHNASKIGNLVSL